MARTSKRKPRGLWPSDAFCKATGRAISECLQLNAHRCPDAFEDGGELEIRIRIDSADGRYPVTVTRIDAILPDEPEDDPDPRLAGPMPGEGPASPEAAAIASELLKHDAEPGDKPLTSHVVQCLARDLQELERWLNNELADLRKLRLESAMREQRDFNEERERERSRIEWRRRSEEKRSGAR